MLQSNGAATLEPLPASIRRRTTPIGRRALEAAQAVIAPLTQPRLILASRHGEYDRTFGLLRSLAEDGTTSPADFSMSVHHGLVGLLSIATGNTQGHGAVAAGADSFAYGLLEAALWAAESGQGAVLIYFDQDLPPPYERGADPSQLAMAVAVHPGRAITMEGEAAANPGGEAAGLATAFLDFVQGDAAEAEARGGRMIWRWRRDG